MTHQTTSSIIIIYPYKCVCVCACVRDFYYTDGDDQHKDATVYGYYSISIITAIRHIIQATTQRIFYMMLVVGVLSIFYYVSDRCCLYILTFAAVGFSCM